jgi:hypothetical protein
MFVTMLKFSTERCVRSPELVGRNTDCAKAIDLSANVAYQLAAWLAHRSTHSDTTELS